MTSEINIIVEKDDKHFPESISWKADDTDSNELYQADAMAFTVWDKTEKTSLALHLWTKDMLVNDMYLFTAQSIHLLAETLEKATHDQKSADLLHDFAETFLKATVGEDGEAENS